MNNKNCPLINKNCLSEMCQWWDINAGQCISNSLIESLDYLHESLREMNKSLNVVVKSIFDKNKYNYD